MDNLISYYFNNPDEQFDVDWEDIEVDEPSNIRDYIPMMTWDGEDFVVRLVEPDEEEVVESYYPEDDDDWYDDREEFDPMMGEEPEDPYYEYRPENVFDKEDFSDEDEYDEIMGFD